MSTGKHIVWRLAQAAGLYRPWVSICPGCESNENVYVYDSGFRFLKRLLVLNNRFACAKCNITWRRKTPFHILRLHSKKSRGKDTRTLASEN